MLPGKDVNPGQYLGHEELRGEPGVEAEVREGRASSWTTRGKPEGLPLGRAEVELSQQEADPYRDHTTKSTPESRQLIPHGAL